MSMQRSAEAWQKVTKVYSPAKLQVKKCINKPNISISNSGLPSYPACPLATSKDTTISNLSHPSHPFQRRRINRLLCFLHGTIIIAGAMGVSIKQGQTQMIGRMGTVRFHQLRAIARMDASYAYPPLPSHHKSDGKENTNRSKRTQ